MSRPERILSGTAQKNGIIDNILESGCYVREVTAQHWKIVGNARTVEFYPTTGTIYANEVTEEGYGRLVRRGVKNATYAVVKEAAIEAAYLAMNGHWRK